MGRFKDISMQMEPYDQEFVSAHAGATQARFTYNNAKREIVRLKGEIVRLKAAVKEAEREEKEAYDRQEAAYDMLINGFVPFSLDGK
jgi:uncharacterized coiled-coil DUF342 family protein